MRRGTHARTLFNHPDLEVLPAQLMSARHAAHQRRLSQAAWLARRKQDGRYLAVMGEDGIVKPLPGEHGSYGLPASADWLQPSTLNWVESSRRLHRLLSVIPDLTATHEALRLERHNEPRILQHAGRDRFGRHLWLQRDTARHWQQMRAAALRDGVVLQAISGYRNWNYQAHIIKRKLARGLTIDDILRVNALPGYSEHHTGHAIDIAEPATPPAETAFETTAAFAWLVRSGADFGFRLSYPRSNQSGMAYEPWHWCWQGS